jgi:hypothetical protein
VKTNMRNALSLTLGTAVLAMSSLVGAQDINVSTTTAQPSATTSTGGSVTDTSGPTDHSVVVGHLALRYFGTTRATALAAAGMGAPSSGGSLDLHTVGIRYWLNGSLGIEGGLSFGIRTASSSTTTVQGSTTTNVNSDAPNALGFGLRVALPIQLAEAKHVSIQLAPYLQLNYARSALQWADMPATNDVTNSSMNFFSLEIGATAQAELQFGFLGAPQLGLIAQFGLGLSYATVSRTDEQVPSGNRRVSSTTTNSTGQFNLGTTIGNYSLADIISGSLSAVWYFGGSPSR